MTWHQVADQLELDAAAYEALVLDPDGPLPAPWSPAHVAGPPPAELHGRLVAALQRLQDVERALVVAKVRKGSELDGLARPTEALARYLDTTA